MLGEHSKTMVAWQWVIELLKRFSDFQVGIGDDEMMAVKQPSFHQWFNLSLNTSFFSCSPPPQHSTWVYYPSQPIIEKSLYCCNGLPQQTKCPTCKPRQCPILISCARDDMGLTVRTNHADRGFTKNHVKKHCLCWLCNDSCSCCWLRWTLIGLWLWVRVCWRWHVILRLACTLKAHYKQSWIKW